MEYFSKSKNVCDMEWTKVMMKCVVEEGIVNAEEDCSLLSLRRL